MKELLRVGSTLDLGDIDTTATPGFTGTKKDGQKSLAAGVDEFADLQERLFAAGRFGDQRSVLLVLQAIDTAGKGAWMTIGYGLEPFIGERHLRQCIEKGRPHFERAQYALGVTAVLGETEKVFHEVISALAKTYGLPRSEVRSPLESQTASAW